MPSGVSARQEHVGFYFIFLKKEKEIRSPVAFKGNQCLHIEKCLQKEDLSTPLLQKYRDAMLPWPLTEATDIVGNRAKPLGTSECSTWDRIFHSTQRESLYSMRMPHWALT